MSDQAPALKIIFQKISRKLLKQILSINEKPLDLDWTLPSPDFEEALFNALTHNFDTNRSDLTVPLWQ
jgi:hypothetical protein